MPSNKLGLEEDIGSIVPIRIAWALNLGEHGYTTISGIKLSVIKRLHPTLSSKVLSDAIMSAIKDKASTERRDILIARAEKILARPEVWENMTTYELLKEIIF